MFKKLPKIAKINQNSCWKGLAKFFANCRSHELDKILEKLSIANMKHWKVSCKRLKRRIATRCWKRTQPLNIKTAVELPI